MLAQVFVFVFVAQHAYPGTLLGFPDQKDSTPPDGIFTTMPAIGVADWFLPATREKSVRMENKGIQLAGTRKKPALA